MNPQPFFARLKPDEPSSFRAMGRPWRSYGPFGHVDSCRDLRSPKRRGGRLGLMQVDSAPISML